MEVLTTLPPGIYLHYGQYRIEKVLGKGGYGITYLGFDGNLHKKVAIKEFFPSSQCYRNESGQVVFNGTESAEFIQQLKDKFIKETRKLASLNHPNIIKIHTAFEENNTAYYVMDYIEGESLMDIVEKQGPLPTAVAVKYVSEIGKALDYLHSQNISHLDVKPANIMLNRFDDQVVLIDFGISKQYDAQGHQTSITPIGLSPGFAPIEQYVGDGIEEFSPRTDIYSLAATLYYLLTGAVPPPAPTLVNSPLKFPAGIYPVLQRAIAQAMSTTLNMRQESIDEFLSELNGDLNAGWQNRVSENVNPPITAQPAVGQPIIPAQPTTIPPARESHQATEIITGERPSARPNYPNFSNDRPIPRRRNKTSKGVVIFLLLSLLIVAGLVFIKYLIPSNERDYSSPSSNPVKTSVQQVESNSEIEDIEDIDNQKDGETTEDSEENPEIKEEISPAKKDKTADNESSSKSAVEEPKAKENKKADKPAENKPKDDQRKEGKGGTSPGGTWPNETPATPEPKQAAPATAPAPNQGAKREATEKSGSSVKQNTQEMKGRSEEVR